MQKLFVPYKAGKPALVAINGHNLIVLSAKPEALEGSAYLDADAIQEFEITSDSLGLNMSDLEDSGLEHNGSAGFVSAGVIVAPDDISADELIESLSDQLPWVQ